MNTTSQMLKDAQEIYRKYFPANENRNILYMATVTDLKNFVEEVHRFLKKYQDVNSVLEEYAKEGE